MRPVSYSHYLIQTFSRLLAGLRLALFTISTGLSLACWALGSVTSTGLRSAPAKIPHCGFRSRNIPLTFGNYRQQKHLLSDSISPMNYLLSSRLAAFYLIQTGPIAGITLLWHLISPLPHVIICPFQKHRVIYDRRSPLFSGMLDLILQSFNRVIFVEKTCIKKATRKSCAAKLRC